MKFEVTPTEACLHVEVGAHLRLLYEVALRGPGQHLVLTC